MFDEFVYVLKAGPYYKIGKTRDVTRRIGELAVQLPFAVELFKVINTDDANEVEKWLHEAYAKYRRNGEWFELPEGTAMWLSLQPATMPWKNHGHQSQHVEQWWQEVDHMFHRVLHRKIFKNIEQNEKAKVRLETLCCFGV